MILASELKKKSWESQGIKSKNFRASIINSNEKFDAAGLLGPAQVALKST